MSVERDAEHTCGTVANALSISAVGTASRSSSSQAPCASLLRLPSGPRQPRLLPHRSPEAPRRARQRGGPPLPFASRMIRVGFCPPYRLASPLSVFCPARSLAQRLARDLPDGCRPKVCQKPWQMDWCRFGGWRHHLSLRDRRRTCSGAPISCSSGSPQTRRIDLQRIAAPHVILMGDRDRPDSEALT